MSIYKVKLHYKGNYNPLYCNYSNELSVFCRLKVLEHYRFYFAFAL